MQNEIHHQCSFSVCSGVEPQAPAELLSLCKCYDNENKTSGLVINIMPIIHQLVHGKVLIFTVHLRTSVFPALHVKLCFMLNLRECC